MNVSNTSITFPELETNDQSIWALLLLSGYMTIDRWEKDQEEQAYCYIHMFMLGLLSSYGIRYEITSNRESGYGRYDIAMIPFSSTLPGVIFEFKAIDKKEFEHGGQELLKKTADHALRQIDERWAQPNEAAASLRSFNPKVKIGIAGAR
jgi:hypothetical protein